MKTNLAWVMTLALVALNAVAGFDSHFYHPDSQTYANPAEDGYSFEEVQFQSADGTQLSGWFIPAQGQAIGTVIHFHGNARNMGSHYPQVSWLPAKGFNLFTFDYRGYGKSQGIPTREGVYEDSVAAVEYIKSRTDLDQSKLIVFGQSIGGANALCVVGKNKFLGVAGIAVDSAFSTYKSIAIERVTWLKPVAFFLIGNKLSPKKYVDDIAPTPLLIIHGTRDRVVSYKHATKLFKKAKEPKTLWTIEGGEHIDALSTHKHEMIPRLHAQFVEWVTTSDKPVLGIKLGPFFLSRCSFASPPRGWKAEACPRTLFLAALRMKRYYTGNEGGAQAFLSVYISSVTHLNHTDNKVLVFNRVENSIATLS